MKTIGAKLKSWCQSFENELYPELSCLVCGREVVDTNLLLCERCKASLCSVSGHLCQRCSMPIPDGNDLCDDCKSHEIHFDKAVSAFMFDEKSANMVYGLKYSNAKFAAKHLAAILVPQILKLDKIDVIIPVPLHENRKEWRGYNQSELIASALSEITSIELVCDCLERRIDTETQQGKSKNERQANVVGAFCVENKNKIANKNVLIIDDVFTTGSTSNECARVLKKAGAAKVFVATILKTPFASMPKHKKTKNKRTKQ